MPTNSDSLFFSMMGDNLNIMGVPMVCTPPGGGIPTSLMAWLDHETEAMPDRFDNIVWVKTTTIEYRYDDLGLVVDTGYIFTYGAIDYVVQAVRENDGMTVKCVVKA